MKRKSLGGLDLEVSGICPHYSNTTVCAIIFNLWDCTNHTDPGLFYKYSKGGKALERYVFIQERRDSQNNIKDCLLRNVATNQIVQVSKDVIKTNLKKKNWIIDGLILAQNTDALCISEKDRLIQDYI